MLAWSSNNANTRCSLACGPGGLKSGSDDVAIAASGVSSSAMASRCARMLWLSAMVGNTLLGVTKTAEAEAEAEFAMELGGAAKDLEGGAEK